MRTINSMRLRLFRFLEERRAQRERPNYSLELCLFAVIVASATWSILALANDMAQGNWIGMLTRIWF